MTTLAIVAAVAISVIAVLVVWCACAINEGENDEWITSVPPTEYQKGYQAGLRRGREMLLDELRNGDWPEEFNEYERDN